MGSETSIADITNLKYDDAAQKTESAFITTWDATDAALLQPSNIAIPKVQRGWDRKPLSPFSRQRLRVGKVWKRAGSSWRNAMADDGAQGDRSSKRRKARNSFQGPLKPVKKICLASDFGMAARVLQWEGAESPVRKIVTRSSASADDIVALPDEEETPEDSEDGDVTVEILDEDGTVIGVGGEELAEQQGWEDEVDTAREEDCDKTTVHPGDLMVNAKDAPDDVLAVQEATLEMPSGAVLLEGKADCALLSEEDESTEPIESTAYVVETDSQTSTFSVEPLAQPSTAFQHQDVVLPDGFVSLIKRPRSFGKKSARCSLNSRRRTLPVQFAPFAIADEIAAPINERTPEMQETMLEGYVVHSGPMLEVTDGIVDEVITSDAQHNEMEQQWEDVEDECNESEYLMIEKTAAERLDDVDETVSQSSDGTELELETAPPEIEVKQPGPDVDMGTRVVVVQHEAMHMDAKLLSSPIPSVEGQHPRLPLRRSPRRKSSSPLKQSTTLPATSSLHFIALTPLKGPPQYPSPSNHPGVSDLFVDEDEILLEPSSPQGRATSAPPEEAQMSPQKPSRPRVSDDTALLQAFLNRAAESKSSRRVSTSKRESMTNRRDSDAIRQALASPAKAEVLGDLDPNSPSPRKTPTALGDTGAFDGIDLGSTAREEDFDDDRSGPTTRRGDRAARRAHPLAPAAPNKIAIRGNAENVFIKRSEAQELGQLTRNNTRKNKAGAVLPPLRLTKLMSLTSSMDADAGGENSDQNSRIQQPRGGRNIRWAETLVEFYQSGEISESSILSDEVNAQSHLEQAPSKNTNETSGPPPPSETPSKPKIRRLKPPRTAATPGKAPPTVEAEKPAVSDQASTQQAPPNKRRSRIATPAKALKSMTLLPTDVDPEMVHQPPAPDKKPAPKKKVTTSKLPAPASASVSLPSSTSASTSLGQGKENLISSPPKKRTVPTAKTFAPKLDFGGKTQVQPLASTMSDGANGDAVPGLVSPAKKAKGRIALFGSVSAPEFVAEKREEVPGLSSPAKKRTRRTGGI